MEKVNNKSVLYESTSPTTTIFDLVMNYLNEKYELRFNTIALELEIRVKENEDWTELNINSLLIELIKSGMNISMQKLEYLA